MSTRGLASRLVRISDWTLIGLVVLAPLAIGGVHAPVRLALFIGAAVALLFSLYERWRGGRPLPITVPLVTLGVAVVATAAQLVPLPAGLLAVIAPTTHDTLTATLGDYRFHAVTLDPAGTVAELAKLSAYLAFFAAAVTYASRTSQRRRLVLAVAGVAVVVALIGFVQAALHSRLILFLYHPRAQILNEIWVRGTFVNPNHFGALMCLGAPCALAIGLRERRLRIPAFLAVILFNLAVVMSLSRAALIAAPLAQLLVFAIDRWQLRRGSDHSHALRAAGAVAIVAALAIGVAVGGSRLERLVGSTRSELAGERLPDPLQRSKFYAWRSAAKLVLRQPWTGAGRGAFEQAYTQVAENGGDQRYRWVENGYLQAAVDWGVPVTALLVVLAGTGLFIALRRLRSDPLLIGALCGLIGLAVHEAVDFSVELPGIALPALALCAVVFAHKSSEPEPGRRLIRTRPLFLAVPIALLVPALVALVMPSAEADGRRLARANLPPGKLAELAAPLVARHPADWYLQAVVAERLARVGHPDTMKWLNRAIFLNPSHPAPHLIAADVLARSGRGAQALVEFRLAAGDFGEPAIWQRVTRRFKSVNALITATPANKHSLLALAGWLESQQRPADADFVLARIQAGADERDDVDLLKRRARLAIARGDATAARTHAAALWRLDHSPDARLLVIHAELASGDAAAAAELLEQTYERTPEVFDLEIALAQLYIKTGNIDTARERLGRLTWELDRTHQIKLHEARAEVERIAGNEHQYRWELEQATRLRASMP